MKYQLIIFALAIFLVSCINNENKTDSINSAEIYNDSINKYYPLLNLIDPEDSLGLISIEGIGLNDTTFSLSIVYEKYKIDSYAIAVILARMNDYNLDILNKNKFFSSAYDKNFLKIEFAERMKMDIAFYRELENLDDLIHIGFTNEDKYYFISLDSIKGNIYCNYQIIKK